MCRSTVNIQSPTAEIRRAKKKRRNRMKIYMVSLFHRATITSLFLSELSLGPILTSDLVLVDSSDIQLLSADMTF